MGALALSVVTMTTPDTPPAPLAPPSFDDFWTLYPRREARKDALKMWNRMHEGDQMAALVAICDWRRVWAEQGRDCKTIPMPATWLNGERWTDELPESIGTSSNSHIPFVFDRSTPYVRSEMPDNVKALIAKMKAGGRK